MSMQLDVADFPVREIRLGDSYGYQSGRLELDAEDLAQLVLQDHRIREAKFDTASPGDAVRITGIRDAVEPRVKFGSDAQVFPGDGWSSGGCGLRVDAPVIRDDRP